jgi:excisionase family DNA binding protein
MLKSVNPLQSKESHMKSDGAAKTPQFSEPTRIMTVRELSAYLHVHPSTIYKLLRRHQIPAFRVGSDWRFNIQTINRWCSDEFH